MLGLDYSQFKNKIIELALAQPSKYYKMREEAYENKFVSSVNKMYDQIYDMLSDGLVDGKAIFKDLADKDIKPRLPSNEISNHALSATESFKDVLDNIFSELLPEDVSNIAKSKIKLKGASEAL
jgi:hypothetical protein